jgi:hypothetical protein
LSRFGSSLAIRGRDKMESRWKRMKSSHAKRNLTGSASYGAKPEILRTVCV